MYRKIKKKKKREEIRLFTQKEGRGDRFQVANPALFFAATEFQDIQILSKALYFSDELISTVQTTGASVTISTTSLSTILDVLTIPPNSHFRSTVI